MSQLDRFKTLKVHIATFSNGQWIGDFGISLCKMIIAFSGNRIGSYKGQNLSLSHSKGSILPKMRYEAVKIAREKKADYLLFVDSDQTFPSDTLHRLLSHQKDVVAANVATKSLPARPTAMRFPQPGEPSYGMPIFTDAESHGLQKVWRIGTGIMLISKKVFEQLPTTMFEIRYHPDVDDYKGEDWNMVEEIEKLGFEVFIDHDLSNQVGHVGFFTFTHEWVGELKEPVQEVVNG